MHTVQMQKMDAPSHFVVSEKGMWQDIVSGHLQTGP